MKKIMKYFLAGMFVAFLLSNAVAQTVSTSSTTTTTEQKTIQALEKISKVVSLTPDQMEKISPFLTEFFKQKDIDQSQYKGNADLLSSAAKARKETLMSNVKTVLTEEQIATINDYLKKQNRKEKSKTDNGL